MSETETYLGDGVYARFDGYQIWLRTERENSTHEIALDAGTYDSLLTYVESLKADATRERENHEHSKMERGQ